MASCPVSTPAESQASLPFVHGTGSLGVYRPGDCPISIGINACQRRVCFHLFVARPRSLNLQPFWRPRGDLNSGIHRRTKGSLRLQVISRQRENTSTPSSSMFFTSINAFVCVRGFVILVARHPPTSYGRQPGPCHYII